MARSDPCTEVHDRFIRRALAIGLDTKMVAKLLCRSEAAVRRRAQRLGVPFPTKSDPRHFSSAQDQIIRILAGRGWKSSDVGERLNRSDVSVRHRAIAKGIKFTPHGGRAWVGYLTSELRAS